MENTASLNSKYFVIILPFFNENDLIIELLNLLEEKLVDLDHHFKLIFVNDGSTDNTEELITNHQFTTENIEIEIIELNNNSGHQNAIRQGLIHTKQKHLTNIHGVIIMDSDGEDNPDAIKELTGINKYDVVFVSRGRRKESVTFKIAYFLYKILFKLITNRQINFGNYSMISPKVLNSIADKHFFHYSAFLSKQRFNIQKINYDRNKRLKGKSKMGFKNLLIHALKSFIEYFEELIFFQVKVFIIIFIVFMSLSCYIAYSKLIAKNAIIGWSSNIIIGLINGLLIMFSSIIISTLLMTIKNTLDQRNITFTEK
jgi:glycosyltransferase involved in cell wall biosynthesis